MTKCCKIAFDVREAMGKPAGVGRIISSLIKAMQEVDPQREYVLIGNSPEAPLSIEGQYVCNKYYGWLWHVESARLLSKNPGWVAYISARSPLVPIMAPEKSIYFVNDLISLKHPDYFGLKTTVMSSLFVKMALKRTGRIVAISHSTANDIKKYCPAAQDRTTVVYLAADPVFKRFAADNKILDKYGIKSTYLLTVGTVEPRKNHVNLLSAYRCLPKSMREKYKLVLVGKKGWKCEHIIKLISEGVKEGSVLYLEYVSDSDLVHIYNGSSLFVYPSLYEGFGLPILEAMSCGVPVVTSNNSSLTEVGGNAACYVDPENTRQLAKSMERVLADQKLAEELSAKGLEQSKNFTWEKAARKVFEIVDKQV